MNVEIDQAWGDSEARDIDSTRVIQPCVIDLETGFDPTSVEQQIRPARLRLVRIQ